MDDIIFISLFFLKNEPTQMQQRCLPCSHEHSFSVVERSNVSEKLNLKGKFLSVSQLYKKINNPLNYIFKNTNKKISFK